MLAKLLKYEIRITGRSLLPIYAALLVLSVLMTLTDSWQMFLWDSAGDGVVDTVNSLIMFTYGCLMSTVSIITVVLLVQRFYKNLLRDEGYLMHTLPVTTGQNLAAKLIAAVLWSAVSLLLTVFSLMIISMNIQDWQLFFEGLGELIGELNAAFGLHWPLFALETLILLVIMLGTEIIQVYLALAIGHMANSRRITWSVAAYIGLSVFANLIAQLLGRLIVNWNWLESMIRDIFYGYLSQQIAGIHIILLSSIGFFCLSLAVQFAITRWIMKNRLNLE